MFMWVARLGLELGSEFHGPINYQLITQQNDLKR